MTSPLPRRHKKMPLLLLGCAALIACDGYIEPEVGELLHNMDPNTVREVLVSASDRRLFAYRESAEHPFQIVFVRPDRPQVERCIAGEGFTRFLEAASAILVVRKSDHLVDPVSPEWVVIELWDGSTEPGNETRLRPPTARDERTIMQWWLHDQYIVEMDGAVWDSLNSGCAALGLAAAG